MLKVKDKIKKLLDKKYLKTINKLNSPQKIQDFLDQTPFNFEKNEETYMSPKRAFMSGKMHCFEGALFAVLCLTYHGFTNYLLDLKVKKSAIHDSDHTLCIFKINKHWGAISKTNHSVLRWRDPIYKNVHELAISYFHEYFLDDGGKTLESYSQPFDVWRNFGAEWIIEENDLDHIALSLDKSKHFGFVPKQNKKFIRKVGKTEIKGAAVVEWEKNKI